MRSQHCLLQPDAASSVALSEVSQLCSTAMAGERPVHALWPCFPPSNDGCSHLSHHRSAKIVCCNLTLLLLQRLLGSLLWEVEGRQLPIWGFVFCLAMVVARPQLPHLCVLSLSLSLGSATVCAGDSGRNVDFSLLVLRAAECVHCFLTPSLLLSPLDLP